MLKISNNQSVDQHFSQKLLCDKSNLPVEITNVKRNIDNNKSAYTGFVFSLPLSPLGIENNENVDTKVVRVGIKRKAMWQNEGIAKKKCINWDTEVKRKIFNTKVTNKKNKNVGSKAIKQEKALYQGKTRIYYRDLSSRNSVTDDQVQYINCPSTSGNTHGKIKVTELNNNASPTRRVSAINKISWRVSIISHDLNEDVGQAMQSLIHVSDIQKDSINNNELPYTATADIDGVKSNRKCT